MNLVTIDTRTPIYVTHIFNYHLVAVSCIEMLYKSIECLSFITLNICVQGLRLVKYLLLYVYYKFYE